MNILFDLNVIEFLHTTLTQKENEELRKFFGELRSKPKIDTEKLLGDIGVIRYKNFRIFVSLEGDKILVLQIARIEDIRKGITT